MIYLLYGSDAEKSRNKLHELVAGILAKKPDATHVRLTDETFGTASLDELVSGAGLFSSKLIVECDMVFRNKEAKEIMIDRLADIAGSENIFIFREAELAKVDLKVFEKQAEKIQEFISPGKAAKPNSSLFALADAFGRRDKKQLWVLYCKAKRANAADEEIHGLLFWQVKAILQAGAASSAKEAGLNPYVYQKSAAFLKNFKKEELKKISARLVAIYHDARRGIHDFEAALEKFILEV